MNRRIDMPKIFKMKEKKNNPEWILMIYQGVQQTTKAPKNIEVQTIICLEDFNLFLTEGYIPRINVIVLKAFRARFCDLDFRWFGAFWFRTSSLTLDLADVDPLVIVPSLVNGKRPFLFSLISWMGSGGKIAGGTGLFKRPLRSICAITDWSFVFGDDGTEFWVIRLSNVTFDDARFVNDDGSSCEP